MSQVGVFRFVRGIAGLGVLLVLLGGCLAAGQQPASAPAGDAVEQVVRGQAPTLAPAPGSIRLLVLDALPSETLLRLVKRGANTSVEDRPAGYISPDGTTVYEIQSAGSGTVVRAVDLETGRELRRTRLGGHYYAPAEFAGEPQLVISGDGTTLLLREAVTDTELQAWEASGQPRSQFALLDTDFKQEPHRFDLPGEFWLDALSQDGRQVYLMEIQDKYPLSYSPGNAPSYQVRVYDVRNGALAPEPVVDKRDPEQMNGYRRAAAFSLDGEWLYSLYSRPGGAPFVHALHLPDRTALCIDLPFEAPVNFEHDFWWALAVSGDGRSLYAVNAATGQVAHVDIADSYSVRRSAVLPPPGAEARRLSVRNVLRAVVDWLAPVARAKVLQLPGAVVSPDGRTLLATGEKGLLAIATADLTLRARYLEDLKLNTLLWGADGRLYTVRGTLADDASALIAVDPASGAVVEEIVGLRRPVAVLHAGRP